MNKFSREHLVLAVNVASALNRQGRLMERLIEELQARGVANATLVSELLLGVAEEGHTIMTAVEVSLGQPDSGRNIPSTP